MSEILVNGRTQAGFRRLAVHAVTVIVADIVFALERFACVRAQVLTLSPSAVHVDRHREGRSSRALSEDASATDAAVACNCSGCACISCLDGAQGRS